MAERSAGRRIAGTITVAGLALGLGVAPSAAFPVSARDFDPASIAFLDTLQQRSFRYFWDLGDTTRGLTPDRWPTKSFVSVAAVGFGLTAHPIGAERGWITREAAARRVLNTLRFFWTAPQDSSPHATGYRGFFYHFLDAETGRRFETVELSTIDTALLLAGALFCQAYFDRDQADETEIRALADSIYRRVDWNWAQVRPPAIGHGWTPEEGYLAWDWGGYNEAMVLYVLALGSPTHPVDPAAWGAFTRGYRWGTYFGHDHFGFAPLFGHQYSHVWIDFFGIKDDSTAARGLDYFENTRRATLAQQRYGIDNPEKFAGYGSSVWGWTACDGPVDRVVKLRGKQRQLRTYAARGASFTNVFDDGTLAPTAAAGSLPFAPEVVIPTLIEMRRRYGDHVYGKYGFVDALNPTLDVVIPVQHGKVVKRVGWFDTDYLGIDQGPIVAMIENFRSELVWRTMRRHPAIRRGLERAGFRGGWLQATDHR